MSQRRRSEWTLYVVAAGTGLHAVEEYFTGWQAWAPEALGISIPTSIFAVMNAILMVAAFALARVGWRNPAASLVIPVATLMNGIAFHIVPSVLQGRLAPGLFTAVGLYLPFSTWAILGAGRDGVPRSAIAKALVGGVLLAIGVVSAARGLG